MRIVRALIITTALVLTTAKATATLPVPANENGAEQCAGDMRQLTNAPELQRILVSFGGSQNLEGKWKLSGLAGSFVQANVTFENRATSFVTKVNADPENHINVCTHGDQITLKLVVLQPRDPNNKIMFVRAIAGSPDKILIAAHASKWKFVKFKRVQSIKTQPIPVARQ